MALPNALIQESVRAFYGGWYEELVDRIPQPNNGYFYPPKGVGLGIELLPDVLKRKDINIMSSKAE